MATLEINFQPPQRDLKWFGLVMLVFFALAGAAAYFRFDAPRVGYVLWAVGVALTLVYYAAQPLRIPLYVAWLHLFFPLGWLVSHLVLALLYYLVITPVGLIARLVGYDPMKRRFDKKATTYWIEHRTGGGTARYLRQY